MDAQRYTPDEFFTEVLKPGPICYLVFFATWKNIFLFGKSPQDYRSPRGWLFHNLRWATIDPAGPLLLLPHFKIAMVKWCAMHIVHLGCDLWLVGCALKTLLLDTDVWGDSSDDDRLLTAWHEFKHWARQNKWQPFSCDVSTILLSHTFGVGPWNPNSSLLCGSLLPIPAGIQWENLAQKRSQADNILILNFNRRHGMPLESINVVCSQGLIQMALPPNK